MNAGDHGVLDTYGDPVTVTAEYDRAQGGWKVPLRTGSGPGRASAWLTPDAAEELAAHLFCRAAEARRLTDEDHAADAAAVMRRVRDGLLAWPGTEGNEAA